MCDVLSGTNTVPMLERHALLRETWLYANTDRRPVSGQNSSLHWPQ
jgi:hypothetical protein